MSEDIYQKLLEERINQEVVTSVRSINRIRKLPHFHRDLFLRFHKYYIEKIENGEETLDNYKNYRSKILDFLLDENIIKKKITEITQKDVEEYFEKQFKLEHASTYNSRISYILHLFSFCKDELTHIIDLEIIPRKKDEKINAAKPLAIKEIEAIREFYKTSPLKLFVFEMLYQTDITLQELKKCNYHNFNKERSEFVLDGSTRSVPPSLAYLIEDLKDDIEYFNVLKDYEELIRKMRMELIQAQIRKDSFKPSDIWATKQEITCFRCPECRSLVEAVAENWVIKQYSPQGSKWIVCKKNCGEKV